jgi:hypothetical protein
MEVSQEVFAEAKTIWQTTHPHAARDSERDILLAACGLCVAVFTKGLSAVADCLSLFSGMAEKCVVEAHQQTAAPTLALKEWTQSSIKCRDN